MTNEQIARLDSMTSSQEYRSALADLITADLEDRGSAWYTGPRFARALARLHAVRATWGLVTL